MTDWQLPSDRIDMPSTELHLWMAGLNQPQEVVNQLARYLSLDELGRAERFSFDLHRKHYQVSRGILRIILANYLNLSPSSIRFQYSMQDKPSLLSNLSPPLNFNLSHSGECVVFLFSTLGEVGVDIEKITPGYASEEIAEQFFSSGEVQALRSLPLAEQNIGFFTCWTRKEAYIKARGDGLSLPLDSFHVSLNDPPQLLRSDSCPEEAHLWQFRSFIPQPGYIGAIAGKFPIGLVQKYNWNAILLDKFQFK